MDDGEDAARRLPLEVERAKRWVEIEKARLTGSGLERPPSLDEPDREDGQLR